MKNEICPNCGLNTGHGRGAKGAMATHIKFAHGKHSITKDRKFVSKEDHERGRKRKVPGKTYKKR